jgi:hypothetical protein
MILSSIGGESRSPPHFAISEQRPRPHACLASTSRMEAACPRLLRPSPRHFRIPVPSTLYRRSSRWRITGVTVLILSMITEPVS